MVFTNDVYHTIIARHAWVEERLRKVWLVYKPLLWWVRVIRLSWHSRLPFKCKVFLWRVMIGGLPLGDALVRRRITNGMCLFCTVKLEHSRHRFIKCPIAQDIWKFINAIQMSMSGVVKSPFSWMFAQVKNAIGFGKIVCNRFSILVKGIHYLAHIYKIQMYETKDHLQQAFYFLPLQAFLFFFFQAFSQCIFPSSFFNKLSVFLLDFLFFSSSFFCFHVFSSHLHHHLPLLPLSSQLLKMKFCLDGPVLASQVSLLD